MKVHTDTLGIKEQQVIDRLVNELSSKGYVPVDNIERSHAHERINLVIQSGLVDYHLDMTKRDEYFDVQITADVGLGKDRYKTDKMTKYEIIFSARLDMTQLFTPLMDKFQGLRKGGAQYTGNTFKVALYLSKPAKATIEEISQSFVEIVDCAYGLVKKLGIEKR